MAIKSSWESANVPLTKIDISPQPQPLFNLNIVAQRIKDEKRVRNCSVRTDLETVLLLDYAKWTEAPPLSKVCTRQQHANGSGPIQPR